MRDPGDFLSHTVSVHEGYAFPRTILRFILRLDLAGRDLRSICAARSHNVKRVVTRIGGGMLPCPICVFFLFS